MRRRGSSWGRRQKNGFSPGLPPPVQRRAAVVCHLRNGAARPSSWELGDGKGGNGLPPGVSGFGPGEGQHYAPAHDVARRLHECPHQACVGEMRARRRKAAR